MFKKRNSPSPSSATHVETLRSSWGGGKRAVRRPVVGRLNRAVNFLRGGGGEERERSYWKTDKGGCCKGERMLLGGGTGGRGIALMGKGNKKETRRKRNGRSARLKFIIAHGAVNVLSQKKGKETCRQTYGSRNFNKRKIGTSQGFGRKKLRPSLCQIGNTHAWNLEPSQGGPPRWATQKQEKKYWQEREFLHGTFKNRKTMCRSLGGGGRENAGPGAKVFERRLGDHRRRIKSDRGRAIEKKKESD